MSSAMDTDPTKMPGQGNGKATDGELESANVTSSSGDEESGQVKVVQVVDRSHNDDDASPSGKDQGNKSNKRQQEQHSKEISAYDEELGFCGSIWVQCKAQRRFVYAMLFSFLTLGIMFWLFSGQ